MRELLTGEGWPQLISASRSKEDCMLRTIVMALLLLWVLGLVSRIPTGGFIHILLVMAVVGVLLEFVQGRRASLPCRR